MFSLQTGSEVGGEKFSEVLKDQMLAWERTFPHQLVLSSESCRR